MILLPRGNPVKEKIDPGRVNLPEALNKLRTGGFSGYLRFEGDGYTAIVIYVRGKMVSALVEEGTGDRVTAREALSGIFIRALCGGLRLDIYRLSPELAMSIHALLHGEVLFRNQELKLIDIKALLGRLREECLNGCLRIYTGDRIALIFYREGVPLGFFHDGSTDIETTADTSMSVARLPGAKIDVLMMKGSGEEDLEDLAETAEPERLWREARETIEEKRRRERDETKRLRERREQEMRRKGLELLRQTAERHIGRIGVSLVEKEFAVLPGEGSLADEDFIRFYDRLAQGARLVAGPARVKAMTEEMRKGLRALLD